MGGPGKGQKLGKLPESKVYPFMSFIRLAEAGRGPQATIERPHHEGYRPLTQEESERTRQHWRHRQEAQSDIELTLQDTAP